MRLIFCGTPDYAVPSLKALAALSPRHSVVAVVSQPDRAKGRSRAPAPPPIIAAAKELGFSPETLFQPRSINRPDVLSALRALAPDVLCVVAYGNILRADALALAKVLPINAHGSLLPKYRGAAPIQAALLSGDKETGISIMKMELGLDSGPVLFSRSIPIEPGDDAGSLHDKMAELSARCFVEALSVLETDTWTLTPQVEREATYAPKLDKRTGQVDWARDAVYLERFVRAMNPWPGAWTSLAIPESINSSAIESGCGRSAPPARPDALRVRIVRASVSGEDGVQSPSGTGKIVGNGEDAAIAAQCGSGVLLIHEVQPEGKRVMSVGEYLRGAGRKFVTQGIALK